jgi:ParB-like chromosome segregation protein Spo0J
MTVDAINPKATRDGAASAASMFGPAQMLAELLSAPKAASTGDRPERLPLQAINKMPELFQPRGISEKHIGDLARAIQNFGAVDPVTILPVGDRMILIDGHHRLEAYERAGKVTDIPVRYFGGTPEQAVLAAGEANSKAKLPMAGYERQNYAWRLVLLGKHSKASIARASGVAPSQVANMRVVQRKLGEKAFEFKTWWQARTPVNGQQDELTAEDRDQWKEDLAADFADRLAKHFSTKLADRPEIAAMALDMYFGRRLPEVVEWLRAYVPESEDDENDAF